MTYCVVFDLDRTLLYRSDEKIAPYIEFESKIYRLAHGALELLSLLLSKKEVELHFFSKGIHERNCRLIEQIFAHLHKESDLKRVRILSRDAMTRVPIEALLLQQADFTFGIHHAKPRKDLSKVCRDLSRCVLVDDCECTVPGQEKNLLKVWPLSPSTHQKIKELKIGKEGVVNEQAVIICADSPSFIDTYVTVRDTRHIHILCKPSMIEIHYFCAKTQAPNCFYLTEKSDQKLYKQIRAYALARDDEAIRKTIEDQVLQLVEKLSGTTQRIVHEMNQMCYVAALLFKGMEQAKEQHRPLPDLLFLQQFQLSSTGGSMVPCTAELHTKDSFYLEGRELLRTINPTFEFYNTL